MSPIKLLAATFCITGMFAFMGCGKILDKLHGGGDDAGVDSGATTDETTDAGSTDTGDAAADAAAPTTTFHEVDRIPTFNAEENLAQKEINAQNYKTQLSDLDNQVKAQK